MGMHRQALCGSGREDRKMKKTAVLHRLETEPGSGGRCSSGIALLCLCFLSATGISAQNSKPTFTTFNAPGAGTGASQGTFAYQISNERFTVGQYSDAGSVNHGYVRAPDGDITTFEAPGAGILANQGTTPNGIN